MIYESSNDSIAASTAVSSLNNLYIYISLAELEPLKAIDVG